MSIKHLPFFFIYFPEDIKKEEEIYEDKSQEICGFIL